MKRGLVGLWFIVCSWSAFGQPLTHAQLTGKWIGVHTEFGPDAYCPLPAYLDLQTQGTYRLGLIDDSTPALMDTWALTTDTVRLGTTSYAPGLVMLTSDILRIGTVFPMTFRRFHDVPIDSAAARKAISNRIWQTDSLLIHLHENGRACLENRMIKQRTTYHWRLARFGESVFILIQGSQYTTGGQYRSIWQITTFGNSGVTKTQFRATGWNGQRVAAEPFGLVRSLLPGDSCRANGFQVCNNCFVQQSTYNIFSLSTAQQYEVQKLMRQHYQPVNQTGQSGLIQVRFVLNCAGEMGMLTMTELDEAYCTYSFDRQITSQLTAFCRNQLLRVLANEAPAPEERPDRAVRLNFRLKDGRLTDIFP